MTLVEWLDLFSFFILIATFSCVGVLLRWLLFRKS